MELIRGTWGDLGIVSVTVELTIPVTSGD